MQKDYLIISSLNSVWVSNMIFNTHSHINDKDINEANELVNECLESNVNKIAVEGHKLHIHSRLLLLN